MRGPSSHFQAFEQARLALDVDDLLCAGIDYGPLGHGQDLAGFELIGLVQRRVDCARWRTFPGEVRRRRLSTLKRTRTVRVAVSSWE